MEERDGMSSMLLRHTTARVLYTQPSLKGLALYGQTMPSLNGFVEHHTFVNRDTARGSLNHTLHFDLRIMSLSLVQHWIQTV